MEKFIKKVTYVKPWKMEGKAGLKLQYLDTPELGIESVPDADGGKGLQTLEQTFPYECLANVVEVPGYYEFGYTVQIKKDKNGKPMPTLIYNDLKFVSSV